jgi:DNA-binding MarR family transcriptional regulator
VSERQQMLGRVAAALASFEDQLMGVRLDAVVATQLSIQQLKVLMLAAHRAPMSAHQVSEALDVSPPTVSGIVGRLMDRGLLTQEPDPEDRRTRHLVPTQAGIDALAEIASLQVANRHALLQRLSDAELGALEVAMAGLSRALGEVLSEAEGSSSR